MPGRREIERIAEETRQKYWPSGQIPVDIDLVIEQEMGIDIIPSPGLRREMNSDACMAADRSTIYVDEGHFMDPRMSGRVRFSLAHELGHYVLHATTFDEFRDRNVDLITWAQQVREHIETSWMETVANEFAGCLLVPKPELQRHFNGIYQEASETLARSGVDIADLEPWKLYPFIAKKICRTFDVSAMVVEIRLKRIRALENLSGP